MSNNQSLMLAIIGTLRPVPAAAMGITVVGSKETHTSVVFGSGVTSQNAVVTLPADCAAGDTVILTCGAQAYSSFAWVAPSGATVILAPQTASSVLSIAVFAIVLTSTDISAGTVNVPCTVAAGGYTVGASVIADARRGVDSLPVDVVGMLTNDTLSGTSTSPLNVSGITTTADGDLLQYAAIGNVSSAGTTMTQPTGWSAGDTPNTVNPISSWTGYKQQATHGATGAVTATLGTGGPASGVYATVMFALRAYNPTFRLTGTLGPATVGTAWTGVLNFAGDYTGTITVDAASGTIPAWMGTPTIDYGSKTITWSATPATGTDASSPYAFTVRATASGGQIAVGAGQSVVVSAASASSPAFVGGNSGYVNPGGSSYHIPLPAGCAAGDYIVIAGVSASSSNGLRSFSAGTLILPTSKAGASTKYLTVYGYELTSTDVTNGFIALGITYSYVMGVWRSPTGVTLDVAGVIGADSTQSPFRVSGITTTVANTTLVAIFGSLASTPVAIPTPYPDGYLVVASAASANAYNVLALTAANAPAGPTGDLVIPGANTGDLNILLALRAK